MWLLDPVQGTAEEASPPGAVAAQPAPPPPFALPSAGSPPLASPAALPTWSVRASPANTAAPVAPPRRELAPAQFGHPAPPQTSPLPLRVRPTETPGLG